MTVLDESGEGDMHDLRSLRTKVDWARDREQMTSVAPQALKRLRIYIIRNRMEGGREEEEEEGGGGGGGGGGQDNADRRISGPENTHPLPPIP